MDSAKRPRSPGEDDEITRSYKRLCAIKRDEKRIDRKVKSINERIAQLIEKREQYANKKSTLKLGPFEKALIPYSRSWNLDFASKLQSRLPRELRDMIYEQLWIEQAREYTFRNCIQRTIFSWECKERPCQCLQYNRMPPFIDPAFVGPEVALEAAAAFYRTNFPVDRFNIVHDISEIKQLVCADAFHVGLNPATVLREVSISIKMEDCVEQREAPFTNQSVIKGAFESLYKITNKSRFKLYIALSQRYIRLKVLEEYLAILRPIVAVFRKEGADVTVKWLYRHSESFISPVERDLLPALGGKPDNWQNDMIAWLEEQEFVSEHTREYTYENEEGYRPSLYWGDADTDEDDDDDGMGMYDSEDPFGEDPFEFCPCGCGALHESEDDFF